ncbi:MAG: oxalate/formate MFS antiporter [Vicinamibacterales bacterium]
MNVNHRWFQLAAALITMVMIANLQYAWTLFVKPLQAETGWRLSDIQLAFTLFILFQTWVQPLDGWLIDRLGPRGFISAAGVLCGLGWAGLGYAWSPAALYTLYCSAGVGAALVYSAAIGSALKWFKHRRGLASGVLAAGFGGGSALFIPVIASMIESRGYRSTFVVTGLVQGLVIVVVAQTLRYPPDDPAEAPPARAHLAAAPPEPRRDFSTVQMVRTPQFYALYLMFVLMATGGLLVTANAGPMARAWGLTTAALTVAATVSPIANGLSRIFWGWTSDRLGRETTMALAFALQAICLLMVLVLGPRSGAWFAATLAMVYFTWGEIYSLFPATVADYFGTRHATSNYSVLYTAKGVASIIGGWFGALLFERSGTWAIGVSGSAAMALAAAGLALGLRLLSAPRRSHDLIAD